jgi:hypothetical protein
VVIPSNLRVVLAVVFMLGLGLRLHHLGSFPRSKKSPMSSPGLGVG